MERSPSTPNAAEPKLETSHTEEFVEQLRSVTDTLPSRINIDPQSVELGLAKLVLTLIEFIRRLLEKQAIRRIEGGDLSPALIEDLGRAWMKLEAKLEELKTQFGLEAEDLN